VVIKRGGGVGGGGGGGYSKKKVNHRFAHFPAKTEKERTESLKKEASGDQTKKGALPELEGARTETRTKIQGFETSRA